MFQTAEIAAVRGESFTVCCLARIHWSTKIADLGQDADPFLARSGPVTHVA